MTQDIAKDAVFVKSAPVSKDQHPVVRGPDLVALVESLSSTSSPASQEELAQLQKTALSQCVQSLGFVGFQATNLARAAQEMLHMIHGRKRAHVVKETLESRTGFDDPTEGASKDRAGEFFWQVDGSLFDSRLRAPKKEKTEQQKDGDDDENTLTDFGLPQHCTVFVGAASNIFLSSVRESLAMVARHRFLDVLVVSGGAFEFDIQRALDPESVKVCESGFLPATISAAGSQRYGNVIVSPSQKFRDFMESAVRRVVLEGAGRTRRDLEEDKDAAEDFPHRAGIACLSPSQFWTRIARLLPEGCDRESSVLWNCVEQHVSVFSPSLVDGGAWEFLKPFARQQQQPATKAEEQKAPAPRLVIDLVRDITHVNKAAVRAKRSGMVVLGGGVVKHHVCNANLMRNGADHSVFINSAQEFDGSDAGARPDEAVSWGKIKQYGSSVKVYAEIAAVFPLLCAMSFGEVLAREEERQKRNQKQ